ncbi:hypothetical protein TNCV_2050151 [Trichonephila clavipes]|nr:hypothetical protein TNCV_2050151 [Trichonephila clavipes]
MLGTTDPMHSNFTMLREMSNRKRFDSGQGGASVETGHKSHHTTWTCRRTQSHPVTLRKRGRLAKDFTNVPDRITIKAPPLMRDFFGGGPTRKKIGGVTGNGLHAVSPHLSSRKKKRPNNR